MPICGERPTRSIELRAPGFTPNLHLYRLHEPPTRIENFNVPALCANALARKPFNRCLELTMVAMNWWLFGECRMSVRDGITSLKRL